MCFPLQREMDTLFATILDDGHDLVGAAKCSLFFVDEEKGEVWSKVATDNRGEIKVSAFLRCVGVGCINCSYVCRATLGHTANFSWRVRPQEKTKQKTCLGGAPFGPETVLLLVEPSQWSLWLSRRCMPRDAGHQHNLSKRIPGVNVVVLLYCTVLLDEKKWKPCVALSSAVVQCCLLA